MAMTPEQWQQLAALKEQGVTQQQLEAAAAAKAPALNPGSPAGNPGYSFGAAKYAPQHYDAATGQVTGGGLLERAGVSYVGKDPNGDTPENRAVFESWVKAQNPAMNLSKLNYRDQQAPTAQATQAPEPTGGAPVDPQEGQQTPDWGLLAQLSPEDQQILKNMNAMSQLSPEEQQGLRDMKAQQQAQAQQLAPMANLSPEEQAQLREMRDYSKPRGLIDMYTQADGSTIGVREDGTRVRITDTEGNRLDENFFNTNQALIANHEQGGKTTKADLQDWWTEGYRFYRNDPMGWKQWAVENPDMATRWYALAQTGGQNLTDLEGNKITNKDLQQENALLIQGAGIDPKENGRYYVTDYSNDLVKDVNTEWGGGDFWKTGTMQTGRGGSVLDFIEENPAQALAAVGAMFVPAAAPAIAAQLGISVPMAAAVMNAGLTTVAGGDLEDVVLAGLGTYGMEYLSQQIPQVISAIDPKIGQQFAEAQQAAQVVTEGARAGYTEADIRAARDLIEKTQANQDPMNRYEVKPGTAVDDPTLTNADIPTSDTPGDISQLPGLPGKPADPSGGGETTTDPGGAPSSPPAGNPDNQQGNLPPTETKDPNDGNGDGIVSYQIWEAVGRERDPAVREQLKKEYEKYTGKEYDPDNAPDNTQKPYERGENPSELGEEEAKIALPPGYVWGTNEWGERVPVKKAGEGDGSGLALGGGLAGIAAIINQIGNPNNQGSGGGKNGGNTGGDSGGEGPGGPGGDGTGGEETPPDVDGPDLPPPVPPGPGDGYSGEYWGQDMSTLYQKPGFGIPDQKALFNFPRPRMLEPMITAAENSDQATFNEWLIKYLESGGDRGGLLAVFGASPMLERSGLI